MNQEKFSKEELEEAWERNARARKYKNGTVLESNNCGAYIVIGRYNKDFIYIQFNNTGAIYIKNISKVYSGKVKDYYAPSVYNAGFIGEGEYNSASHKAIYKRWCGMLHRVYGNSYHTYKDCSVSEHWLNFQNFARDLEELMDKKGIDSLEGYDIDKDIKIKGNKIYSKETISLVTHTENYREMLERRYDTVYIAENLITKEKIEFTNQAQFARTHNLDSRRISDVLNKARTMTRTGDWTFYKKGDKAPNVEYVRDIVYVAENIETNELIEFTNQSKFGREYKINPSCISNVLNGRQKTAGGYRFYRKED